MALTIRPTKELEKAIESIKDRYRIKSSSKVINLSVTEYLYKIDYIEKLENELSDLKYELSDLRDLIKDYFRCESDIKEKIKTHEEVQLNIFED